MAESFKFTTLNEAETVFPDLPWKASAGGQVWVFNSKTEEWSPVSEGQFIVSIADRYEIHDEEPAKAHEVTVEDVEPEPLVEEAIVEKREDK